MLVAIAVAATASLALAQNADKNSAGPTKNDYRLRVIEPREGATVAGDVVRVVVDTRIPSEVGSEKVDVNSMPRPMIDVFLDNDNRGTLKQEQNVIEVNAVSPGPHKLVFVAKNMSNEIIGRQEVNFTATEKVAASTTTSSTTTSASTYTAPPPPAPAAAPAPAPSTSTYESKPPAPAPATTYQSTAPSTTSQSASSSTRSNRLPHTGTSDGLIAVSGLGLLAAGYALRRRQA
jgi:LPXTG-motif cell wall-anchored protein